MKLGILSLTLMVATVSSRADEIHLQSPTGEFKNPSFEECVDLEEKNEGYYRSWQIIVPQNTGIMLQFKKFQGFSIGRCVEASLRILQSNTTASTNLVWCQTALPSGYFEIIPGIIWIVYLTKTCNQHFLVEYSLIELSVTIAGGKYVAATSSPFAVIISLEGSLISSFSKSMPCTLFFDDGSTHHTTELPAIVRHTYNKHGTYIISAICFRNKLSLVANATYIVEDILDSDLLDLTFEPNASPYKTPVVLKFSLSLLLVNFYFGLKQVNFVTNGTSTMNFGLQRSVFEISIGKELQSKLGPGVQPFNLVIENNVSAIYYSLNFSLVTKLSIFSLKADDVVRLTPGRFQIEISFIEGAPAEVVAIMQDLSGTKTSVINSSCSQNCKHLKITDSIPHFNKKYIFSATASNALSSVNATTDVIFHPKVFDVYIVPSEVVKALKFSKISLYICADVGFYNVAIKYGKNKLEWNFASKEKPGSKSFRSDSPILSSMYDVQQVNVTFSNSGMQTITFTFVSRYEKFVFKRRIFVGSTRVCSANVRTHDDDVHSREDELKTRDSTAWSQVKNVKSLGTSSLTNHMLLFADAQLDNCAFPDGLVSYEWIMSRLSPSTTGKINRNQARLDSYDQAEFYISRDTLDVGTHVVDVTLKSIDPETKDLIWRSRYITSVMAVKNKLEFYINGGNSREIGKNGKSLTFETSLQSSLKFNIEWFCSTNNFSLPSEFGLAALPGIETCFEFQDSLLLSRNISFQASTSELKQDTGDCFLRAIASMQGFEPAFADQHLKVLGEEATNPFLRCLYNCQILPQFPVIFRLECLSCSKLSWKISQLFATTIESCQDQEICQVDRDSLKKSGFVVSKPITIIGTGDSYSSTFNIAFKKLPPTRTCFATSRSDLLAASIVTVTCFGAAPAQSEPLSYKFFLDDKYRGFPLLQYGYNRQIRNVIVPLLTKNNASVRVQICEHAGACQHKNVDLNHAAIARSPPVLNTDVIQSLRGYLQLRNHQRMAHALSVLDPKTNLDPETIKKIVLEIQKIRFVTIETVKSSCDLLNHVIRWIALMNATSKNSAWKILTEASEFLRASHNHDDLYSIPSCIQAACRLLANSDNNTLRKTSRLRKFTRLLMARVIPEAPAKTFVGPGFTSYLQRFYTRDHESVIKKEVPGLELIKSGRIINLEVHKFDGTMFGFNSLRHQVDEVISLSVTTGWSSRQQITATENEQLWTSFRVQLDSPSEITLKIIKCPQSNPQIFGARGKVAFKTSFDKTNHTNQALTLRVNYSTSEPLHIQSGRIGIMESGGVEVVVMEITENKQDLLEWSIPIDDIKNNMVYEVTFELVFVGSTDDRRAVYVQMFAFIIQCFMWNEGLVDWSNENCKPSQLNKQADLSCICHSLPQLSEFLKKDEDPAYLGVNLNSFPVTQIEEWKSFTSIFVRVFLPLLCSVLVVMLFLFSVSKDLDDGEKKYKLENYVEEVVDNLPFSNHHYLLYIYSSWIPLAGTDNWITIRLIGTERKTQIRLLQDPERPIFLSGVTIVLITAFKSLGDVCSVQIFHGHGGNRWCWNLNRIAVRNLETNKVWFFICNAAFKPMTSCSFQAAALPQLNRKFWIFRMKFGEIMKNRHLWYSVLKRNPWQIRESSRVSGTLLILIQLLTSMAFNALFFADLEREICPFIWAADVRKIAIIISASTALVEIALLLFHFLFRLPYSGFSLSKKKKMMMLMKESFKKEKQKKLEENWYKSHLHNLVQEAFNSKASKESLNKTSMKNSIPFPRRSSLIKPLPKFDDRGLVIPLDLPKTNLKLPSKFSRSSSAGKKIKKQVRFAKESPKVHRISNQNTKVANHRLSTHQPTITFHDSSSDISLSTSTVDSFNISPLSSVTSETLEEEEMPQDAEIGRRNIKKSILKNAIHKKSYLDGEVFAPSSGAPQIQNYKSQDTAHTETIKLCNNEKYKQHSFSFFYVSMIWFLWLISVAVLLFVTITQIQSLSIQTMALWVSSSMITILVSGFFIETIAAFTMAIYSTYQQPQHQWSDWIPPLDGNVLARTVTRLDAQRLLVIRQKLNKPNKQTLPCDVNIPDDCSVDDVSIDVSNNDGSTKF